MLRAHLGLGSNLGDRWATIGRAVERLCAIDADCAVSPIYETAPVGGPAQGPYLNAVARLIVDLAPEGVLELAAALEQEAGRVRLERFGPRTLDVDVLLLERLTPAGCEPLSVATERLVVPHPRLFERAFVLAPLEDLSPELAPSGWRARLGGEVAVAAAVHKVGELVRASAP